MGKMSKPNVIIFMPDQLRYDCIGTFGNDSIKTPNIDKLASKGTKFTNCFLQHSVCSQSRCSIFSSKYTHVDGHRGLNSLLQPREPNFFKTMKENGYHVVALAPRGDLFAEGAAELSLDEYGFLVEPEVKFGIDKLKNDNKEKKIGIQEITDLWGRLFYTGKKGNDTVLDFDEAAIRSAEKWLDNAPKDKPWVLFLPLIFPHVPFAVEEPYYSMYDRSKMPKPLDYNLKTGHEPKYMQRLRKEYGTDRASDDTWAEITATYYGMISRIDSQLGRVMKKLDQNDMDNKTYTIFFTDHGEYLGDYGLVEKWPSGVSDSLVHEPLIISGPNLPQNSTIDSLCEMVDICPTIYELCGLNNDYYPNNGKSLLPLILKKVEKIKDYSFSEGGFLKSEEPIIEYATYPYDIKATLQHTDTEIVGRVTSIRDKHFTYIYRLYEEDELYDRKKDPGELHNLARLSHYQSTKMEMRDAMLKWLVETSDTAPMKIDSRLPAFNLVSPLKQYEQRLVSKCE